MAKLCVCSLLFNTNNGKFRCGFTLLYLYILPLNICKWLDGAKYSNIGSLLAKTCICTYIISIYLLKFFCNNILIFCWKGAQSWSHFLALSWYHVGSLLDCASSIAPYSCQISTKHQLL